MEEKVGEGNSIAPSSGDQEIGRHGDGDRDEDQSSQNDGTNSRLDSRRPNVGEDEDRHECRASKEPRMRAKEEDSHPRDKNGVEQERKMFNSKGEENEKEKHDDRDRKRRNTDIDRDGPRGNEPDRGSGFKEERGMPRDRLEDKDGARRFRDEDEPRRFGDRDRDSRRFGGGASKRGGDKDPGRHGNRDRSNHFGDKEGSSRFADGDSRFGDREVASRFGDRDGPNRYNDREGPSRFGDRDGPGRLGDRDGPSRFGDRDGFGRFGEKEGPNRFGDRDVPARFGDRNGPVRFGDRDAPGRFGDRDGPNRFEDRDGHNRYEGRGGPSRFGDRDGPSSCTDRAVVKRPIDRDTSGHAVEREDVVRLERDGPIGADTRVGAASSTEARGRDGDRRHAESEQHLRGDSRRKRRLPESETGVESPSRMPRVALPQAATGSWRQGGTPSPTATNAMTGSAWREPSARRRGVSVSGRRAPNARANTLALRRKTCPFLLRVYAVTKGGDGNEEELQVYTWPAATLREIVNLVKDVLPEVRDPSVRLHMKMRSYKTSEVKDIGTLSSAYQSAADRRTLTSCGFKIGDVIYVEVDGSKLHREETETSAELPPAKDTEEETEIGTQAAETKGETEKETPGEEEKEIPVA